MSQLHEIALTYLKSVGPAVGRTMVSYLGGAEEVFKASKPKLLKVPGVGEKTVTKLLRHFGSMEMVRHAPEAELAKVAGPALARKILAGNSKTEIVESPVLPEA